MDKSSPVQRASSSTVKGTILCDWFRSDGSVSQHAEIICELLWARVISENFAILWTLGNRPFLFSKSKREATARALTSDVHRGLSYEFVARPLGITIPTRP